jgi:hypothetical protein
MCDIVSVIVDETLNSIQEAAKDTPTFTPNPNLGEGKSTQPNLDHRQNLLDHLSDVDKELSKVIESDATADDKNQQIDNSINKFISTVQNENTTMVNGRWDDGWSLMNGYLEKAKIKINKPINPSRLQSILRQQNQNIEDLALRLRGRLRQIVNLADIRSYYQQDKPFKQSLCTLKEDVQPQSDWSACMLALHKNNPDMSADELEEHCGEDDGNTYNAAFNQAQLQLDTLGLFGWLESFFSSFLGAGLLAMTLYSTLTIELPWLTCDDTGNCVRNGPCEDCIALAASGPYPINNYPSVPHDLCQCNDPPGEPIISFS